MDRSFRCKACGVSFRTNDALKQHNKAKHRMRSRVTTLSYVLIPIFLIGFGTYSGFLSWLAGQIAPQRSQITNQSGEVIIHIHPRLEIFIDGKRVTIPADIGIDPKLWKDRSLERYGMPMQSMREMPFMSPLHTHDTSGTIHLESTVIIKYSLGEFFDIWGMPLSESCVLDKCGEAGSVVMYVDGVRNNEFRSHILKDGETIRIEFKRG